MQKIQDECLSYRTVQSQRKQHHEEDQSPKRTARHCGYGGRIHNEHQSWSLCGHFIDILSGRVCHVTENRKDDKPSTETCYRIDDTRQNCVPAQRIYELINFSNK